MHLLITGSRSINPLAVELVLDGLHAKYPITRLTHGNARGVDTAAAQWARHRSSCNEPAIERVACPADWDRHGKRAGLIRNEEMLATCPALDCAYLAIWDGKSTGTAHMRGLMQNAVRTAYPEASFNAEPMDWHNYSGQRLDLKGIRLAFHIPQHIYQAHTA